VARTAREEGVEPGPSVEFVAPSSAEEAAGLLHDADAARRTVRFIGGGTKSGWGMVGQPTGIVLSTSALDRLVRHNQADLTAVLDPGLPLTRAQEVFGRAGQMLALDPPNPNGRSTVGGIVATGDSGPLRHRYGAPRDLLLGIRVALADGTLARAGGTVIKNVAGYDLAKLFAGSFGTLGFIVEVVVRLHPLPARRATAAGRSDDPAALQRAAIALAKAPLELESLDVRWQEQGAILARVGGVVPVERADRAAALMAEAGLRTRVAQDDDGLWEAQRGLQRTAAGAVLRVSTVRSELARALEAARRLGAAVVGRAGLGLLWVRLPPGPDHDLTTAIGDLRATLAPRPCAVLDAPEGVRAALDPWGDSDATFLMRRVKQRFDPNGTCNPGTFVGGI
jgi:glycolate oxidase FAD binding subunit